MTLKIVDEKFGIPIFWDNLNCKYFALNKSFNNKTDCLGYISKATK